MNDYVVYTVLTAGYENVLQPLVLNERFDYVLFSNDFSEDSVGVWQIIECLLKRENEN